MLVKRHLIGTKQIETIQTREVSKVLMVKLENDRSLVELFVAEDDTTPEIQKNFLIVQENYRILYSYDELEYVGSFSIRNGLYTFWVFEIKSDYIKNIGTPVKKIEDVEINIVQPIIKESIKKWKRLPKPDLNKTFTEEELKDMHPERQLKYILIKKYNLKGRIINKLSIDNQIRYIIQVQNGDDCSPEQLLHTQKVKENPTKESIKLTNENQNNILVETPPYEEKISKDINLEKEIVKSIEDNQVTIFDSIEFPVNSYNYKKISEKLEIPNQYVLHNRYTEITHDDNSPNVILVFSNKFDNQLI